MDHECNEAPEYYVCKQESVIRATRENISPRAAAIRRPIGNSDQQIVSRVHLQRDCAMQNPARHKHTTSGFTKKNTT